MTSNPNGPFMDLLYNLALAAYLPLVGTCSYHMYVIVMMTICSFSHGHVMS